MKKLLAILIMLTMLFSFASAEDVHDFVVRWNITQKHYPCMELSEDTAEIANDYWIFTGDVWKMAVMLNGDHIKSVGIYAEDFETLVGSSIVLGTILTDDTEGLNDFIGYLVMKYFFAKTGEDKYPMIYGNYTYGITKQGDGYMVTFADI